MPLHIHICEECGKRETVINKLSKNPVWPKCCGSVMPRSFNKPHSTGAFDKPIEMYSIALNTDQDINEFRGRNPSAEISNNPADPLYGIPIARTRQEKKRILKNEGFQEKS